MKQNSSKAPMIKSAAYNKVQRFFQTKRQYNRVICQWENVPLDPLAGLSDAEKLKAIEEIMKSSIEELKNYRKSRKKAKEVHENRLKTGYYEKKAAKKQVHKARVDQHQNRIKELQNKLGQ